MAKNCIKCGAKLDDDALFCDECGAEQKVEEINIKADQETKSEKNANQINMSHNNINNQVQNINSSEMHNSGIGIASLILGIVSVVTLGIFIVPEILGLVFGILAISNKKYKHDIPIAGVVLSIIAFVLFAIIMNID